MLMERLRHSILFALLGFTAIVGQIILQRRFFVVFGGNELTIGIVFAGWMLWAGLGNFVAGRFADRIKNIPFAVTITFFFLSLLLPVTVFVSSLIKPLLNIPPPQMMGIPAIFATTLTLLFPFCFMIGIALVLAAKIPATGKSSDIGLVYIFDSIGSAVGGILFSWFAIRFFTPLQSSLFLSVVLMAGTGLILQRRPQGKLLLTAVAIGFAFLFFVSNSIETVLNGIQWKGYNAVANFDSRYGNIVVTENRSEHTLFFDGVPQFTTPLPETYETAAYLPLLMHPAAKDVLVIGGGLSGMIHQWRDIDLNSITYIQIDPDITSAERRLMIPDEMIADPRLKIHYVDGRKFLKSRGEEKNPPRGGFDVVIIQAGDPASAATNRYYTKEFFEDVRSVLNLGGVLFFGIFEPTNYFSSEVQNLLGSIYATIGKVFDHIVVLPLDKYYFIASSEKGSLIDDIDVLRTRLDKSGWHAPTLSTQVLYGIFPERIAQTREVISNAANQIRSLNTDRHPLAYYAGLVLWAARGGANAAMFLESLKTIRIWHIMLLTGAAALATILFSKRQDSVGVTSFWTLFAVGFSSIVYEMVLLIWYQVKVGLLFYRLGIIITAFMVGLSVGAYGAIRLNTLHPLSKWCKLISPPFVKGGKGGFLALMMIAFAGYMPLLFLVSQVSFPLANFLCGLAAGFLYQTVADMLVTERKLIGSSAGLINFSDYLGAAIGSILASIIMIPLFGLFATLLVAAFILLVAAAISAKFIVRT